MAGGPARKGLDGDEFSTQMTYFIDSSITFLNLKSKKKPSFNPKSKTPACPFDQPDTIQN
jgi:hypothetical protein